MAYIFLKEKNEILTLYPDCRRLNCTSMERPSCVWSESGKEGAGWGFFLSKPIYKNQERRSVTNGKESVE